MQTKRGGSPQVAAITILSMALWPNVASAHPNHDQASFAGGLAHPLFGIDHLAAMVAIGLVAARYGRAAWTLPAAFVAAVAIGALSGLANPNAAVETAVALSVIGIGIWLIFGARLPLALGVFLAGAAGLMHGWAHGAELPAQPTSWWFVCGALITTALLHAGGLLLSLGFNKLSTSYQAPTWSAAGAAVIGAGIVALVG
jgi:urease accessory protein